MAKREQASRRASRDPWVPAALVTGNRRTADRSVDVEEWLPTIRPGSNGSNGHAASNGSANGDGAADAHPSRTRPRRRQRLPKRATARERWLILRLRRSRRRAEEQREEIERLEQRISELEVRTEARKGPAPEAGPARTRKPKSSSKATAARKPASRNGRKGTARRNGTNGRNGTAKRRGTKLDLNDASFEELRGLGLSVTQSARLIAHRDTGGGFASVDDLDSVQGLAKGTVSKLRTQVLVAGR